MNGVAAVVVTFEPKIEILLRLLTILTEEVNEIFVVDNHSTNKWYMDSKFTPLLSCVNLICLSNNEGIAYAQNRGIEMAILAGHTHILFSDQDSLPISGMVRRLYGTLNNYLKIVRFPPVAAIGPATVDTRTGQISSFIDFGKNSFDWKCDDDTEIGSRPHDAAFLISSGMLVPVEVFKVVAGFRSGFFIDHVDTEWCFRARSKGYRILGLSEPLMQHTLGDSVRKIWFLRNRQVLTHSPLRDYYMARNTIAMIKGGNLSIVWSSHFIMRLIQFFGYYTFFSENRIEHLFMILKGVWHGMLGLDGRLNLQVNRLEDVTKTHLDP